MEQLHLLVETLRCEAGADEIADDLLAQDGVVEARVDLDRDLVQVRYDEGVTTEHVLLTHLRYFGLVPAAELGAPN